MSQEFEIRHFPKCVRRALDQLKQTNHRIEGLNDLVALEAASKLVDAAAFNLAARISSDDVVDLMLISHQLTEFVKYLEVTAELSGRDPNKLM